MSYVGDLDAKDGAMLQLVEQQWNAGLNTEACAPLRTHRQNTIGERQDWLATRDRLAELTNGYEV